jgi:hypothetical protein
MEWCAAGRAGENDKTRHLRLIIDSCYAGLTLARMLLHPNHWAKAVIRDGLAACLPSEEAFELSSLGHCVLTHTRLRPYASALPPDNGWTAEEYRHWRAAQRETTQYLTSGQQHALDVINGHNIRLIGSRSKHIELTDMGEELEVDRLREALDNLPRARRPDDR